jgi:hypothetical protein
MRIYSIYLENKIFNISGLKKFKKKKTNFLAYNHFILIQTY